MPGSRHGAAETGHREGYEEHGGDSDGRLRQLVDRVRSQGVISATTGRDQQLGRLHPGGCRGGGCRSLLLAVGVRAASGGHSGPQGTSGRAAGAARLPDRARVHADEAVAHQDRRRRQRFCS